MASEAREGSEPGELTEEERKKVEDKQKQQFAQEAELKKEILALIRPIFSEAGEQKIWYFNNPVIGEKTFKNVYLRLIEASSGDSNEEQMVKHGFLLVADYNDDFLSDSRELFLNSFCRQIVTVVSKAILDKMEKEAGKGRSVQLGLLPKAAPDSAGRFDIDFSFVAAKYLGGDFFDFLDFEGQPQIGMIISDVSGKGIGPSLFGATCKVFLQWYSLDRKTGETGGEKSPVMPPGEVLCAANDKLCEEKKNNLFATIFYCVANTETLELSYASAGHNKMFHVTAAGEIIELSAKGVPLGLFSPMFYQTKKLQLSEGDWVILYTDGVTELEDPVLELYDMTRLKIFIKRHLQVSATVFRENLERELEMYRKGVLFDGITLLRRSINFFNNFYRRQLPEILEFSGLEKEESDRLFNEFTEQFSQAYFAGKNDYFENNIEAGAADAAVSEIEKMLEEIFTEYTGGQKEAVSGEGAAVFLNMTSQLDSRLYEEAALLREEIVEEVKDARRKIAEKGLKALNTGVAASDDITFIVLRVNHGL
jgi:serine phosphatase RsbU (regulator of sigma subunit)